MKYVPRIGDLWEAVDRVYPWLTGGIIYPGDVVMILRVGRDREGTNLDLRFFDYFNLRTNARGSFAGEINKEFRRVAKAPKS